MVNDCGDIELPNGGRNVFAIQQHWADCLRHQEETCTSGADNLKTFALVEAAYESAASKATVEIGTLLK